MFREDLKNKNYSIGGQHTYKNMQNVPIKFQNKKGILVLTLTLLKYMSLSLNKFKLGFCSDTYLPFGPYSRFLLFFFRSSLSGPNLWQELFTEISGKGFRNTFLGN